MDTLQFYWRGSTRCASIRITFAASRVLPVNIMACKLWSWCGCIGERRFEIRELHRLLRMLLTLEVWEFTSEKHRHAYDVLCIPSLSLMHSFDKKHIHTKIFPYLFVCCDAREKHQHLGQNKGANGEYIHGRRQLFCRH